MPIAEFTEVSLAYERIGSGVPLLLIMGVGGQLIQWPPDFQEALQSEGFELILVDNRDIGLSSKLDHLGIPNIWNIMWKKALGFSVDTPYTLEDMAADYIELLDHLNIQQCHILGISMGSMISQILASKYPDRISTVTLVHTGTGKPRHSLGIKPRALKALASRGTISSEEEYAEHFQQLFSVVGSPDLQRSPEKN
jgi:pimeloyl-ACP methyl ester carboxylesterase